jgi:hypothetical protein
LDAVLTHHFSQYLDLTEEDHAVKLSALLKKAHVARTAALFTQEAISDHVTREAERIGLDRNMVLGAYMGFIAHLLNPCQPVPLEMSPDPDLLRSLPGPPR